MCLIHYSQTINRFTKLDLYPLPRMDDLALEILQYKFYTSLDLKSAYHQIPIQEEDKQYTAFEANGKLYQFCRVPFGVTNGVACFHRTIDNIIKWHHLRGTYAYVDNIVAAGKSQQEHDENLTKFRNIAHLHDLTFNEKKSVILTESIDFLGYTISQGKIKLDAERLQPLKKLPIPKDKTALHTVIGLFSYYFQWIPKFSDKIRPLIITDIFPLKQNSLKAFNNLKDEIGSALLHGWKYPLDSGNWCLRYSYHGNTEPSRSSSCLFLTYLTPTECKHFCQKRSLCHCGPTTCLLNSSP